MDLGFESTLSILPSTVNMSLNAQRAVACFVTEGETRFSFPRLWSQKNMSKQCLTVLANFDWLPKSFSSGASSSTEMTTADY